LYWNPISLAMLALLRFQRTRVLLVRHCVRARFQKLAWRLENENSVLVAAGRIRARRATGAPAGAERGSRGPASEGEGGRGGEAPRIQLVGRMCQRAEDARPHIDHTQTPQSHHKKRATVLHPL